MYRSPEVFSRFGLLLLLLMPDLFMACSRDLAVELPYEGPQLVVMAILSPDRLFEAHIERTYPPTGISQLDTAFSNANVLVYQNSQLVDTLRYVGKNQYQSSTNQRPKIGATYKLMVTAPGYPTAESGMATIPDRPAIRQLELSRPMDYEVSLQVDDVDNQTNWYSVELAGYYQKIPLAINVNNLSRPDAINDNCAFRQNSTTFFYRDVCFSNRLLTVHYSSSLRGTPQKIQFDPANANPICDALTVRVRSVTEAYWKYYRYMSSEGVEQVFQQPATRYSNIKGGYGIVAAYSETAKTLVTNR